MNEAKINPESASRADEEVDQGDMITKPCSPSTESGRKEQVIKAKERKTWQNMYRLNPSYLEGMRQLFGTMRVVPMERELTTPKKRQ
jgi:hypothetical protein